MVGTSDEDAEKAAEKNIEDMKKVSKYPNDVKPENKDPEEIMDILNELDEMFENSEENDK